MSSFDLLTATEFGLDWDEQFASEVFDEYLQGVRRKWNDLKGGYISGKRRLIDTGEISRIESGYLGEQQSKDYEAAKTEAKRFSQLNVDDPVRIAAQKRYDFLMSQLPRQQQEADEANKQMSQIARQLGLTEDPSIINRFNGLSAAFKSLVPKETMSALIAEYGD